VESCLADLGPQDRLLVLDNGSTDETVDFALRTAKDDDRLELVRTGAPDLSAALDVGIELASTELLARMDADDVVLPARFDAQVAAFEQRPDLVLLGTQIKRFTTDPDRSTSVSRLPLEHDDIVGALLKGRHGLSHPTVMFRRTAALAVGGYWAHGVSEDCDFFLRLSRLGRVANLPGCGLAYRFHRGSLNARKQTDILIGMRYAAATYLVPRDEAPDLAAFRDDVLASPRSRLALRVSALSDRLYRDAQFRLLERRFSVVGAAQLAGAGLLRLDKGVDRLRRLRSAGR
jgi:glycosyltransferase involved in cell wall biosynthesis